jgi:hypothetical protein
MSFNEDSAQPDIPAGAGPETDVKTVEPANTQPSVRDTDRYGLYANKKGFLLQKYNVAHSKAGAPYFEPIPSVLAACQADAEAALAEARARAKGDVDMQAKAVEYAELYAGIFDRLLDDNEGREWFAKSMIIWPMTDQVGYQLYKSTSGEADLADYGAYLLRDDDNVKSQSDIQVHENYQKRESWVDLAYTELALWDAVVYLVDSTTKYNTDAMIRSGYQSAANLDTRNHLRGLEARPAAAAANNEVKENLLASRRAASAS